MPTVAEATYIPYILFEMLLENILVYEAILRGHKHAVNPVHMTEIAK